MLFSKKKVKSKKIKNIAGSPQLVQVLSWLSA